MARQAGDFSHAVHMMSGHAHPMMNGASGNLQPSGQFCNVIDRFDIDHPHGAGLLIRIQAWVVTHDFLVYLLTILKSTFNVLLLMIVRKYSLMTNIASGLLDTAKDLVAGPREHQHGSKLKNHQNIARIWSGYLVNMGGKPVDAHDVANLMELLKVARRQHGAHNMDDYVDGAGYSAVAFEVYENMHQTNVKQPDDTPAAAKSSLQMQKVQDLLETTLENELANAKTMAEKLRPAKSK